MKYVLSCWLIVCLLPPLALGKDKKRILILGDSLTAGYGVAKSEAFPAVLQKILDQKNKAAEVVSAGSSGSTSASAMGRLRWHLKKKPDILILALGANDGLRGTPIEATEKSLGEVIDLAKEKGIVVYLAGMKLPMNYGKKYRMAFSKLFKDLVRSKNIKTIPFLLKDVAARPEFNLADGIHPNEKGHQKVAQTVYAAIKEDL